MAGTIVQLKLAEIILDVGLVLPREVRSPAKHSQICGSHEYKKNMVTDLHVEYLFNVT